MTFTPWARSRLLSHLRVNSDRADEALEWLERELRWAFEEERGFAVRYTHSQLVAALRTPARCDPTGPPPALLPAFFAAVRANERISTRNAFLPDNLGPLPYDDATLDPRVWTDLGAEEVIRRSDVLYLAIRGAGPTIGSSSRVAHSGNLCVKKRSACARSCGSKSLSSPPLRTSCCSLSRSSCWRVDPTFPQSPDNHLVESIRSRLAKAMKSQRH
jgi:hypothetical protein